MHPGSSYPAALSRLLLAALVGLLCWLGPASLAQAQGAASGFELALHGQSESIAGKTVMFRGGAYRVHGLATLKALPGARIRARYTIALDTNSSWQEVKADTRGFFKIEVTLPDEHMGSAMLEFGVGDGQSERLFSFSVDFAQPWQLDLRTDRRLYEPGENIHVWSRLRDSLSLKPLANQKIHLLGLPGMESKGVTAASGVMSAKFRIPKNAKAGSYEIVAKIDDREWNTARFDIGTRNRGELMAKVTVEPAVVGPEQEVECIVRVTRASGAVVRGAEVELDFDGKSTTGITDAQGILKLQQRAPAYMSHATGRVSVSARVKHPAYGAALARTTLGLTVPRTVTVEAVASTGAVVPEVPGLLYFRLSEGEGKAVAAGTSFVVHGPAIRGGRAQAKTDIHGMAVVPTFLPLGVSAGEDLTTTHIRVEVHAAIDSVTDLELPVTPRVEVVPTIDKVVVSPGDWIEIRIHRRRSARKVPVVVELLADSSLLDAQRIAPGVNRVRMRVPVKRLGVLQVRTRPLHESGVVEGVGGVTALVARPSQPSFPSLHADKELYSMKSVAKLKLTTNAKAGRSWASVLVRDLAAHAMERSFAYYFLQKTLDRAILSPSTGSSDTFLRAALADYSEEDTVPVYALELLDELGLEPDEDVELYEFEERVVMRDPFPLAQDLQRRGVGQVMVEVEELLRSALHEGQLAEVAIERRGVWNFRPDVLSMLDETPLSLGERELSLSMLLAADTSFTYNNVGRRIARERLVQLLVALAAYLDPGEDATLQQRSASREPSTRWLGRMVEVGLVDAELLADPWGNRFVLRPAKSPSVAVAIEAAHLELVSPGPDGRLGTGDDISDPFLRAVPAATPYAVRSGEDELMALLSRLAPGAQVLETLLAAYQRVGSEVTEEEIGDAVSASVSRGWGGGGTGYGTIGHGSGSGFGGGRGGMRSRRAKVPQVRVGATRGQGQGSLFSRVLREKFPATLLFAPDIEIDSSGRTNITIPLADAATTYLVEVVVWDEDGWTWSTSQKIRVDREGVIDAPVPRFATVGDRLELPVHVGNRGETAGTWVLTVDGLGIRDRRSLNVPAKDTGQQTMSLELHKAQEGKVTLGLLSQSGKPIDAVRRPMKVRLATRRVRQERDRLVSKAAEQVALDVPAGAIPRSAHTPRRRALPLAGAYAMGSVLVQRPNTGARIVGQSRLGRRQ